MQRIELEDFPEYLAAKDKVQTLETKLRKGEKRRAEIESESASATLAHRAAHRSNLRREFEELESQEPLLREEITSAKKEFEAARRQSSELICQQARPAFAERIVSILGALKVLSESNAALEKMRFELEQAGVDTGSIAVCVFSGIGRWNEKNGGQLVGYQWEIRRNFPELEKFTI